MTTLPEIESALEACDGERAKAALRRAVGPLERLASARGKTGKEFRNLTFELASADAVDALDGVLRELRGKA